MNNLDERKHMGLLFKNVNKSMVRELNKELEDYGVTLMQMEVLGYIYLEEKKHNINQKDIEQYFNSTNPTITGLLNRLQAKELIVRKPSKEDARYKNISLTQSGREIVEDMHRMKMKKMHERITKNLSNEEEMQLILLLNKVLEGLEA